MVHRAQGIAVDGFAILFDCYQVVFLCETQIDILFRLWLSRLLELNHTFERFVGNSLESFSFRKCIALLRIIAILSRNRF